MRSIITFLLISVAILAQARLISPDEARSIATGFLNNHDTSSGPPHKAVRQVSASSAKQPFYVFNADGSDGFVIVAGDTRLDAILGYSEHGNFDENHMPPQLAAILAAYAEIVPSLPENESTPARAIARAAAQGVLLSTQWGQDAPYNNHCPIIDGSRAMTGCVATAMAQVINYEKKTAKVASIPEYWCQVEMPRLPERSFDFGSLDEDDVAALMLYCGQAVRMNYGRDESGAAVEDVPAALRDYFGWDKEVRLISRSDFNDEHWNRMVREEIEAGHPVIYSGLSQGGGGHCFVVDGTADDYFHVNWGWDGNADGYYNFSPFASESRPEFILMQSIVTTRDDDPSADVITYGTTIDGINYQLNDDLTAAVLPLKNGEKYRGDLDIPSSVVDDGKTYTVAYFGARAFTDCGHLTSIHIPASVIYHDWAIFDGCVNLHKVYIDDLIAFINLEVGGYHTGSPLCNGADLYLGGQLVKDLVIPDGIEKIGYCQFASCTSIESVTFPASMKVVGQGAFSYCPNLKKIDMESSSIWQLDLQSFYNCPQLKEVTLPATLTSMFESALSNNLGADCRNMRKIRSLAVTPPWSEHNCTFHTGHYSDAILYVPDESVDQYRIAKEWCNFTDIRPLSEEQPLPETVTITSGGLAYEINLTGQFATLIWSETDDEPAPDEGWVVPEYVEYLNKQYPVEEMAYWALALKRVKRIDAKIRKVGRQSFYASHFDDNFELPASLTSISPSAFEHSYFTTLILPETLAYIGQNGFANNDDSYRRHIESIEIRNPQPPVISDDSFDEATYAETPLKVPYGSKKAYAAADGWCNFKSISNIGATQEDLAADDLTLTAAITGPTLVRKGMQLNVEGNVRNSGSAAVAGFSLSWAIDGMKCGEKHFDTALAPDALYTFRESLTVDVAAAGAHELQLYVSIDDAADDDLSDNTVVLPFETMDKSYYRVSLLEQFTSEHCVLTPWTTPKIFAGIENSGHADFVAHVTHHCGYYDDFLTLNHDYEWFYNDHEGTYTPAMMLNRTDVTNSGDTPVGVITDRLDLFIMNEARMCDALVSLSCDIDGDILHVKTLLEKNEDFDLNDGYDFLTIFVVEDNIPAQEQRDPLTGGYITDYVHNNTVRRVLTGIWGDRIEWQGDMCAWRFETDIDPAWNPDNLKAVAFIHRYDPFSPLACQVYTANSSALPQYGTEISDDLYELRAGLRDIAVPATAHDVYNLMGIKVRSAAQGTDGLPAGIYISGGRKIYVK